jgi:hypothetical protein
MAYRLTTGEEVAQENITVALLAFLNAARVPKAGMSRAAPWAVVVGRAVRLKVAGPPRRTA